MGQFYTLLGALVTAGYFATAVAAGKIRLYQTLIGTVNQSTTLAQLEAAEASFSGYPAGGIAVVWDRPYYAAGGGGAVNTQLVQFSLIPPGGGAPIVGQSIGGFWVDDGTTALIIGSFPAPVPMQTNGQAIPLSAQFVFGL